MSNLGVMVLLSTDSFLPYGHQIIEEDDQIAVSQVLESDWLTTGPNVDAFEQAICQFVNAKYGIAVSSGTAALHATMFALEIGKGDEVIVTPMTFVASSNCILYQGGIPVFVDVDPETLLIDPKTVEAAITSRTKAIIAVDYAGQPCLWDELRKIANKYHLALVDDACHALGAEYKGKPLGGLADLTVYSFHPVKHITTGEGGMIVTNDIHLADRLRLFRGHGINLTANQREKKGAWFYEMTDLGFNYRITDFQCALGISQLRKLRAWIKKRNVLADAYTNFFSENDSIKPLGKYENILHAYHLYIVRTRYRDEQFKLLRNKKIGCNVHYMPIYLHPYYQQLGYKKGLCPVAEKAFHEILTLPLWAGMNVFDVKRVALAMQHNLDSLEIENI